MIFNLIVSIAGTDLSGLNTILQYQTSQLDVAIQLNYFDEILNLNCNPTTDRIQWFHIRSFAVVFFWQLLVNRSAYHIAGNKAQLANGWSFFTVDLQQ